MYVTDNRLHYDLCRNISRNSEYADIANTAQHVYTALAAACIVISILVGLIARW